MCPYLPLQSIVSSRSAGIVWYPADREGSSRLSLVLHEIRIRGYSVAENWFSPS